MSFDLGNRKHIFEGYLARYLGFTSPTFLGLPAQNSGEIHPRYLEGQTFENIAHDTPKKWDYLCTCLSRINTTLSEVVEQTFEGCAFGQISGFLFAHIFGFSLTGILADTARISGRIYFLGVFTDQDYIISSILNFKNFKPKSNLSEIAWLQKSLSLPWLESSWSKQQKSKWNYFSLHFPFPYLLS